MPKSLTVKKDTKAAIMDAAEILMAEHGVNGASIRAIVTKAGANTAAIHYHFNSREGLIAAILRRRGGDVSRRRLEMIQAFDRGGGTPTSMDIVNVLVDPMIELLEREGEAGRRFLRFIARLQFDRRNQSDRTGLHIREERKYFPDIRVRLLDMIKQANPKISAAEQEQRLTMTIDTMLQSFANAEFMTAEWTSDDPRSELLNYAANLKTFLEAGLAAPATKQKDKTRTIEETNNESREQE